MSTAWTQEHWLSQALWGSQGRAALAVAALCLLGLVLALRALWRVSPEVVAMAASQDGTGSCVDGCKQRRRAGRRLTASLARLFRSTGATATMEFTLVFPVALFLMLALAQTTLLMGANIFIHYAAFTAARSAIVQIPRDDGYEAANSISNSELSYKHQIIERAAAFALVPISGEQTTGAAPAAEYRAALEYFYTASALTPPKWVATLSESRLRYAMANTVVTVMETNVVPGGHVEFQSFDTHDFGPKDPVTVLVEHKFHLAVPYAATLFSSGRLDDEAGGELYSQLRAYYTLSNEGINSALPPLPPLPRRP